MLLKDNIQRLIVVLLDTNTCRVRFTFKSRNYSYSSCLTPEAIARLFKDLFKIFQETTITHRCTLKELR